MTETPRAWRLRFSLLTSLLLLTIAAMAISLWQLYADLAPLRSDVKRLRNEVGELSVDDNAKLHAIIVPTDAERTWKWRIWIPKGRPMAAKLNWGDIPLTGVSVTDASIKLDPGEHLLIVSAKRDESGSWKGHMHTGHRGVAMAAPSECFAELTTSVSHVAGMNETEVDADLPFVLGRYRVAGKGNHDLLNEDVPMPGFIIWLESIP